MISSAEQSTFAKRWLRLVEQLVNEHSGLLVAVGVVIVLVLAFTNLTSYPVTWYDEGSHLHVPKSIVQTGVYADRSSEGFRYFGPTNGVGPTVILPIAAVFQLAGVGLLQARLVMAVYLLLALGAVYKLAQYFGGTRLAVLTSLLVLSAPGVSFLEYGRQVLGEVPGFFYLAVGLIVWFSAWNQPTLSRLVAAGALLGLSTVTKNQYLLVIAPALLAAWFLNMLYYRVLPQRVFLVTGIVTALSYLAWQIVVLSLLGPGTWQENLALQAKVSGGAAFIFSPTLLRASLGHLIGPGGYFGLVFLGLAYGVRLGWERSRAGFGWAVLSLLAIGNIAWFSLASISWLRYAFPGLLIACLLLAKLFLDLLDSLPGLLVRMPGALFARLDTGLLRSGLVLGMGALILVPLAYQAKPIFFPPPNYPVEMARYLDSRLAVDTLIETWEPEMGFLTDHRYHYPPQALLYTAVGFMWLDGPAPADLYPEVFEEQPEYILVGNFSTWVNLYTGLITDGSYIEQHRVGPYVLYQHSP